MRLEGDFGAASMAHAGVAADASPAPRFRVRSLREIPTPQALLGTDDVVAIDALARQGTIRVLVIPAAFSDALDRVCAPGDWCTVAEIEAVFEQVRLYYLTQSNGTLRFAFTVARGPGPRGRFIIGTQQEVHGNLTAIRRSGWESPLDQSLRWSKSELLWKED